MSAGLPDNIFDLETVEIIKLIALFDVKLLRPIMESINAKVYKRKTIRK